MKEALIKVADKYSALWLVGMMIPLSAFIFITDFGMSHDQCSIIQIPLLVFQVFCMAMTIIHMKDMLND